MDNPPLQNNDALPEDQISHENDDKSTQDSPCSPLVPPPDQPRAALITGAASGIGRAVSYECAKKGWTLVLVDINESALLETAHNIKSNYNIEPLTLTIDLSAPDAPSKCLDFCDQNNLEIDFLANIAGFFIFDPLLDADLGRTNKMLDLHAKTLTNMSILFGRRMRQRRYGFIMNMSSMSAWMPMPGIATYNATKAYVRSVSNSLWFELKPWNVSVTAVCPGGCNTPLIPLRDDLRKLAVNCGVLMQPEKLAQKALKATLKRKKQTIPGIINHFFTALIVLLPDWLVRFIAKRVPAYKRFYPEK